MFWWIPLISPPAPFRYLFPAFNCLIPLFIPGGGGVGIMFTVDINATSWFILDIILDLKSDTKEGDITLPPTAPLHPSILSDTVLGHGVHIYNAWGQSVSSSTNIYYIFGFPWILMVIIWPKYHSWIWIVKKYELLKWVAICLLRHPCTVCSADVCLVFLLEITHKYCYYCTLVISQ